MRNMQKITKAMKMVAAARLRRAQERVVAARPYANTMTRVLGRLAARSGDFHHPLLDARGDQHIVLALVTADKGLCGGFNTNLNKAAQQFIREHPDQQVELVAIGRKGRDFFRHRPVNILREYINVTARTIDHEDAAAIARDLMDMYTAEGSTIDKVYLIYNEFKTVLSQRVNVRQLLQARLGAPFQHFAGIDRQRARGSNDRDGFGVKERGRSNRDSHVEYESRAASVDHPRDHRSRIRRKSTRRRIDSGRI